MSDTAREKAYIRTVERRFNALRESGLYISPRDFSLLLDWFERGVPAELVIFAIEEVFRKAAARGGTDKISTIAYCRRAVETAWKERRSALLGASPRPPARAGESSNARRLRRTSNRALQRPRRRPSPLARAGPADRRRPAADGQLRRRPAGDPPPPRPSRRIEPRPAAQGRRTRGPRRTASLGLAKSSARLPAGCVSCAPVSMIVLLMISRRSNPSW